MNSGPRLSRSAQASRFAFPRFVPLILLVAVFGNTTSTVQADCIATLRASLADIDRQLDQSISRIRRDRDSLDYGWRGKGVRPSEQAIIDAKADAERSRDIVRSTYRDCVDTQQKADKDAADIAADIKAAKNKDEHDRAEAARVADNARRDRDRKAQAAIDKARQEAEDARTRAQNDKIETARKQKIKAWQDDLQRRMTGIRADNPSPPSVSPPNNPKVEEEKPAPDPANEIPNRPDDGVVPVPKPHQTDHPDDTRPNSPLDHDPIAGMAALKSVFDPTAPAIQIPGGNTHLGRFDQPAADGNADKGDLSSFDGGPHSDSAPGKTTPGDSQPNPQPGPAPAPVIPKIPLDPGAGGRSITADGLQKGDIILSTSDSFQSAFIRTMTKGPTDVSHAAVYVGDGMVVEAVGPGVRRISIADSVRSDTLAVVVRNPNLTDKQRDTIADFASKQIDKPYSLRGLVNIDASGNKFMCSELVKRSYLEAGTPLTQDRPVQGSPGQIEGEYLNGNLSYVGHLKAPPFDGPISSGLPDLTRFDK